jgi:hypothetical protein
MGEQHYTFLAKQLAKFVYKLPGLDGADAIDPAAAGIYEPLRAEIGKI